MVLVRCVWGAICRPPSAFLDCFTLGQSSIYGIARRDLRHLLRIRLRLSRYECLYLAATYYSYFPLSETLSRPKCLPRVSSNMHVLITGGAGFIGAHVSNELLARGYRVRVLDSLVPQVHGPERQRPTYLDNEVELMVGDIRDAEAVTRALSNVDAVIHLVALVGVGQSMYQIAQYTSTNNLGTATLMEALSSKPVERMVVASSMSIYGEGYRERRCSPRTHDYRHHRWGMDVHDGTG